MVGEGHEGGIKGRGRWKKKALILPSQQTAGGVSGRRFCWAGGSGALQRL